MLELNVLRRAFFFNSFSLSISFLIFFRDESNHYFLFGQLPKAPMHCRPGKEKKEKVCVCTEK